MLLKVVYINNRLLFYVASHAHNRYHTSYSKHVSLIVRASYVTMLYFQICAP